MSYQRNISGVPGSWEKGPRHCVHSVGETSKIAVRILLLIPGWSPTGITSNPWANCSSDFMLIMFVLCCKTWNVTKPGAWLARPLQGLNNLKIYPPFYLWCCKSCTQAVTPSHSQSGQCPGRLEARSEAVLLCLWSLNKTIFVQFPNSPPQDCLGWRPLEQGKITQAVLLTL